MSTGAAGVVIGSSSYAVIWHDNLALVSKSNGAITLNGALSRLTDIHGAFAIGSYVCFYGDDVTGGGNIGTEAYNPLTGAPFIPLGLYR